ncbi:MAG TPA: hypothetical protein VI385_07110 [Flavisolibacter sp.]
MKLSNHSPVAAGLNALLAVFIISSFCLFIAAKKAARVTQDLWRQLGLTQEAADMNINFSFQSGMFLYEGAKNAKDIAMGNRVAVVNQLVAYSKKYMASPKFQSDYLHKWTISKNDWEKRNPDPATFATPVTGESIRIEERQRLEKQLKVAEDGLNSPNPKVKNGAPYAIENTKKQIAALEDPNNAVVKRKLDEAARMAAAQQKQYLEAKHVFDSSHPKDPAGLVKIRLQEILNKTVDIDYAAELKDGYNGKKVFVNPAYESKPVEWKLAFRAGKAATDAIRAAAVQWLKELKSTADVKRSKGNTEIASNPIDTGD